MIRYKDGIIIDDILKGKYQWNGKNWDKMYKFQVKYECEREYVIVEAPTYEAAKSKALKSGLSPIISIIRKREDRPDSLEEVNNA